MAKTAMGWLQDFSDCLDGTNGPEWAQRSEDWLEDHPDLPTDGTSWTFWREFRQSFNGGRREQGQTETSESHQSHWLTRYDPDDGEPYGEVCDCKIGEDHDGPASTGGQ